MQSNGNNNGNNQQLQISPQEVFMAFVVGAAVVVFKYGEAIQLWFYNHLGMIVFCGILFLAIFGYLIFLRMEKKGKEEYERMKRLQTTKAPSSNAQDYYRRPNGSKSDYNGRDV